MSKRKKAEKAHLEPIQYTSRPRAVDVALDSLMLTYTKDENPNQMDASTFAGLVASMERNDFLQPVLVREDEDGGLTLIDGHHRYEAAKVLGRTTLSAVVVSGIDAARSRVLGLGLNRYRGDQVLDRVAAVLQQANVDTDIAFDDLAITSGFDDRELKALLERTVAETPLEPESFDDMPLDDSEDRAPRPFVLEIRFERKEEFQAARKALKKAAGKGGDLAAGMLNLIGANDA